MAENKVGSSLEDKRKYDQKLLKDQRRDLQREEISKKKILKAEKFFKTVDDRKKKFTGPKATENSLGDAVNRFRDMSDNMEVSKNKLSKGGRVEYKHGGGVGCAKRGFGKALKKGKK